MQECIKKFCTYRIKKQPTGHFCYVDPLKLSKQSDRFMYVFFDTECTQDLEKFDDLLSIFLTSCAQQMCCNAKPWMI